MNKLINPNPNVSVNILDVNSLNVTNKNRVYHKLVKANMTQLYIVLKKLPSNILYIGSK